MLCILATNLIGNIDEAFMRRITYVVRFPFPDAAMREEIYRRTIPAAAPLADDIDWAFLAEKFELSGGHIKNIVLSAAFLAALEGQSIGMSHLLRSAVGEMKKNETKSSWSGRSCGSTRTCWTAEPVPETERGRREQKRGGSPLKRNTRFTLGKKLLLMVLLVSLILSAAALAASYWAYLRDTRALYGQFGESIAKTLASRLNQEELDGYARHGLEDERYQEIQDALETAAREGGAVRMDIVCPQENGLLILFSTGEADTEGRASLGDIRPLKNDLADVLADMRAGGTVDPVTWRDGELGWRMMTAAPVPQSDGGAAAYVVAELDMGPAIQEERGFLLGIGSLLAVLAAGLIVAYMLVIRRSFIQPIRLLTKAAQDYEGGEDKSTFTKVKIKSHDELRTLSDAFRMMLVEIDLNNFEQKELAVREQKLEIELQLANELNSSMLPKELPQREQGYEFDVHGLLCSGREVEYDFYDYFMLDQDRLCVIIGAVPGEGIPQALYTVMAQTAIKSQLRSGVPLAAAMTAANSQLHEMSGTFVLHALVGVLDGMTGKFSCINAGQEVPLLMRSQDWYEWVQAPPYAPLGQNENVVYQVLDLELHQGDRMFFHTQGLGEIQDQHGKAFSEEQLRAALNLSESRGLDLVRQLEFIRDEAAAYSSRVQVDGYAMLTLEYRRKDRAMAHCVLTAGPEGERKLMNFLRGQLKANGYTGRRQAEAAVLADELFVLCCQQAEPDARFLAQCAIPEGEDLIVLRLKGPMGAKDPLKSAQGDSAARAAEYVVQNTQRVTFETILSGEAGPAGAGAEVCPGSAEGVPLHRADPGAAGRGGGGDFCQHRSLRISPGSDGVGPDSLSGGAGPAADSGSVCGWRRSVQSPGQKGCGYYPVRGGAEYWRAWDFDGEALHGRGGLCVLRRKEHSDTYKAPLNPKRRPYRCIAAAQLTKYENLHSCGTVDKI